MENIPYIKLSIKIMRGNLNLIKSIKRQNKDCSIYEKSFKSNGIEISEIAKSNIDESIKEFELAIQN